MTGLTEAQRDDIERRVDEGVWFLDHVMPDWAWRVDLSKLDMNSVCNCVAGQVVGRHFSEALASLDILGIEDRLGFAAFNWVRNEQVGGAGWDLAHELWQEAVLERRPNVLIGGEYEPVPV